MPLDMHPFARQAAEAALAAGAQGRFWEMHDKLFANQAALDRANLERYATELHLNMKQFKQALDKQTYRARVDADIAQAKQLGVAGTPAFFVAGQRIGNWTTDLTTTAQRELTRIQAASRPQPGRPDPTAVYRATIDDAPVRGAANPKVTLVEWADFECPYCARLNDAIDTVLQRHPDELRVVYKQFPLANHPHGPIAAEASLAAKAQGRFWPMQKALFQHQTQLDRAGLLNLGQSVGLDVAKLATALDAGTYKQAANAESAQGQRLGVASTPAFFIDGKFYSGALPADQLDAAVTQAIAAADARIAKGTPRARLYDALMKTALTEVKQPPVVDALKQDVDPGASAPSRGRRGAPVTIVEFSDFQCPYCKRAASLVEEVQKQHGDDVRVVFRNFPLPYHKNAQLAASAALAAKEQGRFWQMHDELFAHQTSLDRATIDGLAQTLGLDVAKFDAAIDEGKLSDAINKDVAAGLPLVDGTPTLFVNGHKLSNPALLAQAVDGELRHKH
ncbi:MAG TPA: thioredoxin domain-containing protein, partial [Polyangia bacterium]|nr:thioredoxin domain-containing protein [Polyangia bacterium]